uniref:Phosphatase tensin-type domain-containing protein n=1 Tax=Macrostomum lignano TaxID=282301 RepID=A0A1I8FB70_9PLAT
MSANANGGQEDASTEPKTVIHVDDFGFREALETNNRRTPGAGSPRKKTLRIIESLAFRLATMALILLDLVLVIVDLADPKPAYDYVGLVIVILFVIEVGVRIFALGVVFMSVPDLSDTAKLGKLVCSPVSFAYPASSPWSRVSHREEKPHQGNASRGVAQNKKRYEDDGFDLDLCYITVSSHDRVERYLIDDHNVPRLSDMVKFANSVRDWLAAHEQNIIVVHCKGGKECLDFFGLKRTDYQQGIKFQGVETPSQNRYPSATVTARFLVSNFEGVKQVASSIWASTRTAWRSSLGDRQRCSDAAESTNSAQRCEVQLFSRNRNVPTAYENCAFFFWIYTLLHSGPELDRTQLDNPHKTKTWKAWHENFAVEVLFDQP